jgi:PAS domain S-box-containing protein
LEKHRIRLVTIIQRFCLASLTLLALIFLVLRIVGSRQSVKRHADEMRADYITQQKELTKSEMERVLRTIEYQRSRIETQAREIVRQRVYEAHAIAENLYEQNRDQSREAVQKMIVDALRPLHFNQGTGYYFIVRRSDAVNILQTDNPELEGKSQWDLQDADGKYILRDGLARLDREKEFFYHYLWTKPGEEGYKYRKFAYIKTFAPFDWAIGTGLYVEDVEAQTQQELLEQISAIRYGKNDNGYFVVGSWQGVNLAHGTQPELVGTDMWETVDSHGAKATQQVIALAKQDQGGFTEVWWRKPDTGEERPKIVYTRGIRDWQWFVGTGVYTDDIEEGIVELEERINQELYLDLTNTVLSTGLILLLFLVSFRIINRRLLRDFSEFSFSFEQAAIEDKEIDRSRLRFAELYQMAGNANRMLREKVVAQRGLQDEKDRYKALHEATFGGIIIHAQGKILDCNQSLSDITGYSSAELIGMNAGRLMASDSLGQGLQDIGIDNQGDCEAEGLRKDGSRYPMALRKKTISYQGRRVKVIEIRDITERKQAEAALQESESTLRNILLNLPIAIMLTDEQKQIRFRNKRFIQLFGYGEEDVKTLDEWWHKAYPDDNIRQRGVETWEAAVNKARSESTYFGAYETPIRCQDGSLRSVAISGIPLEKRLLTAFIDVTERKRMEEERQNIEKLKAIGTLAGGIAHDFNNILTALYGNVSLAKAKLPSEHSAFRFIESAEKSMGRATRLTNQLLTFAKGGEPVKTSLCLADLIKEVVDFNLSGSNVKSQISEPDDLWLANVDPGQIQQVFGNLTINAKQAMPDGGHLSIALENVELMAGSIASLEAGNYIRILVTDEGVGIASDYLERIFEPYFTTKQTGSGLGLATSYSIISRHGGHISVTSEPGQGTTFILYLPATAAQEPLPQKTEIAIARPRRQAKILVMDDEEMIRMTLSAMLEELGYSVETCTEGSQALDLYRQASEKGDPFDLVILDLTIPGGIGGKETAQNLLAFDPRARIVISSGYAEEQLMAEQDKFGLAGVISKPYTMSSLETTLHRVLDIP